MVKGNGRLSGDGIRLLRCFAAILLVVSCKDPSRLPDSNRTPLVAIDNRYLYYDELLGAMAPGLSSEDSLTFSENYIRNWVSEQLLYDKASRNVGDMGVIDALVESYRRTLIVHEYERKLIEQKFDNGITEQEIDSFYRSNLPLFTLKEPLVRGVLVKLPLKVPGLTRFRSLFVKNDDSSLDEIEKYCLRNAVTYEPLFEVWTPVSHFESILPVSFRPLDSKLSKDGTAEVRDSAFVYFVKITEMVKKGDPEPLDRARGEIRTLLRNSGQVKFVENIKDELYRNALDRNQVEFFNCEL